MSQPDSILETVLDSIIHGKWEMDYYLSHLKVTKKSY